MKTWQKPTLEQVERVAAKLTRPAAYRYFFSGLNNPEWIEPLRQKGFFDSPPLAFRDEDQGTLLLPDWPAAKYLARVAPERPELVAEIVREIPDVDNEEFYRELIEIALRLPASLAVSISSRLLHQRIKKWSSPSVNLIARLIAHLADDGKAIEAFKLANKLFAIDQQQASPDARTSLEIWEYSEALKTCLPSLARMNSESLIAFLCTLLESALFGEGLVRRSEPQTLDMSTLRSSEFGDPDDSSALGLSDILAKKLCAAAIETIRSDAAKATGVINALEQREWALFRAIALHVLAEAPPVAPEIAKARMLDARIFYDSPNVTEYSLLLKKRFGELSSDEQTIILDRIWSGPDIEKAVANYSKFGGKAPPKELLDRFRKTWLRDRLLWIPEDFRSTEVRAKLSALLAEIGLPEPTSSAATSWYEPRSPKSDEELERMSPSEVFAYLRSWTPSADPQNFASRGGLARQLQTLVRERPNEFADFAHEVIGLAPIYVRHLFWALDEALTKGNRQLNWSRIAELGAWMVSQPRGQESQDASVPFPFQDDQSWIGTRHAAAHLFSDGLVKDSPPGEVRQVLWSVIAKLSEDPNPTRLEEDGSTVNEWAARSINAIRGNAIHAVIYYARWLKIRAQNDDPSSDFSFDRVPEVRLTLDEHLDIESDPSLAVRSIYGQHFALLKHLDAKWAKENASIIFPDAEDLRPYWIAAWSAYIKFSGVYNDIFEMLRPQYALAVERIVGEKRDSHVDDIISRLGAHLMTFYWRGFVSLTDHLISRFMLLATPKERGDALGFVGRSLINTKDEAPLDVKNRLQALWEQRLKVARSSTDINAFRKELAAFSYWFSSGQFEDRWAILQLQEVMNLIAECGNSYLVIKRLAAIAPKLPLEAVSCLETILHSQGKGRMYVSTLPEVRTVLDVAVTGVDREAKEIAIRIANLLAEQGDLRFRELADKAKLH